MAIVERLCYTSQHHASADLYTFVPVTALDAITTSGKPVLRVVLSKSEKQLPTVSSHLWYHFTHTALPFILGSVMQPAITSIVPLHPNSGYIYSVTTSIETRPDQCPDQRQHIQRAVKSIALNRNGNSCLGKKAPK